MSGEPRTQGMLDTNILILHMWINQDELPDEMAISAITLAELSAGPHAVRRNEEQDVYDEQPSAPAASKSCSAPRVNSTPSLSTPRRPASTGA
jgi:hypothetical protein